VFLASDEVLRKQMGRKALIILSDGVDNASKTSLETCVESAQRADTVVYSIYFTDEEPNFGGFSPGFGGVGRHGGRGGGRRRAPAPRQDGRKILWRISEETGGAMFEVSKKHPLDEIYDKIQEELRSQYSLGYGVPPGGAGYRKIHVTAKQKGFTVQARDGYYAG